MLSGHPGHEPLIPGPVTFNWDAVIFLFHLRVEKTPADYVLPERLRNKRKYLFWLAAPLKHYLRFY